MFWLGFIFIYIKYTMCLLKKRLLTYKMCRWTLLYNTNTRLKLAWGLYKIIFFNKSLPEHVTTVSFIHFDIKTIFIISRMILYKKALTCFIITWKEERISFKLQNITLSFIYKFKTFYNCLNIKMFSNKNFDDGLLRLRRSFYLVIKAILSSFISYISFEQF